MAEYLKVNYNGLSKSVPTKETLDALTTEFNSLKAIYGVNSLNAPNASYTIQPYSNQTGYVGTASKAFNGGYFKYLDISGVSIASGDIVPKTADTGEIGYGSQRWKDIHTNNMNAHHIIVNADILPDNNRGAAIGSSTLPFNTVSLYSIAGYYTKDDATPFLNIFAHPSEADSDTNAYGTAVQFVTYYKPSGAAKIPHYLRFAASSATNCALTYSKNGQTGDTISIGTSAAPFDNIYGTNVIASSIVRPSTSSGASLGSASYTWNNLYTNNIKINNGDITPIVDATGHVGTSSLHFQYGYFDNMNIGMLKIETNIIPTANNHAVLGSSTVRWNYLYSNYVNVVTGILPDAANGAYVGTSTSYMSTGYFTNLYNRGSTGANNRIPVIKYSTAAPSSTTGYTAGDIWIQYES